MYYNYHAVAKRLIREGKLSDFIKVERWGNIAPAYVLIFEGHRPMPIREERVPEYLAEIASSPSSHLIGGGDTEE